MLQHSPPQKERPLQLLVPDLAHLDGYADALRRGWSPDNTRPVEAPREELARIAVDPVTFVASLDDPEAKAGPVTLPDGTTVARLPGYRRWMWDGAFCGSIGFRWQMGTAALPAHVLGHIGYAVVPWKRQRGYATSALGLLLKEIVRHGLPYVELTTDPDNLPSQKVITANGGVLAERFTNVAAHGGTETLRFRILL